MRCLRTKKQVASTADIASREINEIAMIDHAEFSKVGMSHISTLANPAYCFSVSPEALDTNTACILIPAEFPATETQQNCELEIPKIQLKCMQTYTIY